MNDVVEIGVDEAGYGPLLGSLNLCVFATLESFTDEIQDSKKIYKRNKINTLVNRCQYYFQEFDSKTNFSYNEIHNCEPWHYYLNREDENIDLYSFNNQNSWVCLAALFPSEFNQFVAEGLNKAEILTKVMIKALSNIFSKLPSNHKKIELKIDRLGGRKNYTNLLKSWGATIHSFEEQNQISTYETTFFNRQVNISFQVKGDTQHHCIAAASCFAKLHRELNMENFNHWWLERIPSLKKTAGYYIDGKRFIEDIELYRTQHNILLNTLERNL
jgi:ribonuclease HII